MKRKTVFIFGLLLAIGLTGCRKNDLITKYNLKGICYIAYHDIDTVCETDELLAEGERLLKSQAGNILLSYVMDSAIALTEEELGKYDHLVYTNPRWIEKYSSMDDLKRIDYESLTQEMQTFLHNQMAILTIDGSTIPDGTTLYQYEGDSLLAFPANVTLGMVDPIEAKNPLIILVENPTETYKIDGFILPLTSSGNILFEKENSLREAFASNKLQEYGNIQIVGE